NRRPNGQSILRHGGDGGNQDRVPHDPELSLVAAHPLPAGDPARALKRAADKRNSVVGKRAAAIHPMRRERRRPSPGFHASTLSAMASSTAMPRSSDRERH